MKKELFSICIIVFLTGLIPINGFSQAVKPQRALAVAGDTVWVIINQVKADKRSQYERFLHDVFWPGAGKLSKEDQKLFRQTRVLHPVAPEADGTYSYFFIMDPLIPKSDYTILNFLTKMYGEAKAKEHYKLFSEALAGKSKMYKLLQSPH